MLEPDLCGESGLGGIHMSVSAFLALSQILRVTTFLADIWPFSQRAATILDQVLARNRAGKCILGATLEAAEAAVMEAAEEAAAAAVVTKE